MRLWPRRISIPRINCTHATQRTQPLARAPFRAPFSYLEERRDKDGGEGERRRRGERKKERDVGRWKRKKEKKKKRKNSQRDKGRRNGETMQFLLLSRDINIVLYRSRSSWHIRIQITPGLRLCLFNQLLKLH